MRLLVRKKNAQETIDSPGTHENRHFFFASQMPFAIFTGPWRHVGNGERGLKSWSKVVIEGGSLNECPGKFSDLFQWRGVLSAAASCGHSPELILSLSVYSIILCPVFLVAESLSGQIKGLQNMGSSDYAVCLCH